jgi:thymidine kinase
MFNGRLINGEYVRTGQQVAIDGQQATYESLCGTCYLEKVGPLSS